MKAKLLAIWATIVGQVKDIWNRSKIFLLAAFAVLLAVEWEHIKALILTYMGQKEIKSDEKKDSVLAAKESEDNAKADALVQQAQALPSQEKPVGADWNKK